MIKKLTKEDVENLNDVNWEGIIVVCPKNFEYGAELYIYSLYIDYSNKREYRIINLGQEDSSGFTTWSSFSVGAFCRSYDDFDWYQFNTMTEFFKWYLAREGYKVERPESKVEISTYEKVDKKQKYKNLEEINKELTYWEIYNDSGTDSKLKELIEESYPQFKEQRKRAKTPIQEELKKKITRKEKYRDILEYIERRIQLHLAIGTNQVDEKFRNLEDWLNEEVQE